MRKEYEVPELTLTGKANDVVMGSSLGSDDFPNESAPDFEFEQD
jgi:hypothetical protein